MVTAAAVAQNARLDALDANHLGRALDPAVFRDDRQPGNWARFVFFDPDAQLLPDWERAANECVAILRSEAARRPYDRELADLVGELATRSTTSANSGRRTMSDCSPQPPDTSTIPSSAPSSCISSDSKSAPTPIC